MNDFFFLNFNQVTLTSGLLILTLADEHNLSVSLFPNSLLQFKVTEWMKIMDICSDLDLSDLGTLCLVHVCNTSSPPG